jgi:transposase, IS5 family
VARRIAWRGQPGLFDLEKRYSVLSAAGDPLERLTAVVDFERFRDELDAALDRSDRVRGGRPPYDAVLMFKVLALQMLYTLFDDQTEYQIKDRLSFMGSWAWRSRTGCRMPRRSGCSASS